MISRNSETYEDGVLVEQTFVDIQWEQLRIMRNCALDDSDWRFMSDQSPSDDWVNYRTFLRDLPENYPGVNANEACDAWEDYEKPEGV